MNKSNNKMSFEEIRSNRERFLKEYGIVSEFNESGCDWDELMRIGQAHEEAVKSDEYSNIVSSYLSEISKFDKVHSYSFRVNATDSLLKKIITKSAKKGIKINFNNYLTEITDLIGIRIIYIFKEDYYRIYEQINEKYSNRFAENIHIKLRTGDDKKIYQKILQNTDPIIEENNVYRSIHYTLYSKRDEEKAYPKIEIQTRTIFEEGWGEISHSLVYKNTVTDMSDSSNILDESSKILSALVGNCDSIATLMKTIYDEYVNLQQEGTEDDVPVSSEVADDKTVVRNIMKKFLID